MEQAETFQAMCDCLSGAFFPLELSIRIQFIFKLDLCVISFLAQSNFVLFYSVFRVTLLTDKPVS